MKIILFVIITVGLIGCNNADPAKMVGAGELRLEIFKDCMKLAKQVQQETHYNYADEIVAECSNQAYYMSNQIMLTKRTDK